MMEEKSKNDLVIYVSQSSDLVHHVKELKAPIGSLNPETRIISNNDMYAGGFRNLKFDEYGIMGQAYIRFLQLPKAKSELSLLEKMTRKLHGEQKPDNTLIIEHEGKKYIQAWSISTDEESCSSDRLFWLGDSIDREIKQEVIKKLKTRIMNEKNIILSNDLIFGLFSPLCEPTIQTYQAIINY